MPSARALPPKVSPSLNKAKRFSVRSLSQYGTPAAGISTFPASLFLASSPSPDRKLPAGLNQRLSDNLPTDSPSELAMRGNLWTNRPKTRFLAEGSRPPIEEGGSTKTALYTASSPLPLVTGRPREEKRPPSVGALCRALFLALERSGARRPTPPTLPSFSSREFFASLPAYLPTPGTRHVGRGSEVGNRNFHANSTSGYDLFSLFVTLFPY